MRDGDFNGGPVHFEIACSQDRRALHTSKFSRQRLFRQQVPRRQAIQAPLTDAAPFREAVSGWNRPFCRVRSTCSDILPSWQVVIPWTSNPRFLCLPLTAKPSADDAGEWQDGGHGRRASEDPAGHSWPRRSHHLWRRCRLCHQCIHFQWFANPSRSYSLTLGSGGWSSSNQV